MYFFGHFFFSKFCCFWYFAKVSQAHAGLKRSLLGMHSEANNCEHGLRTTKIMASNDRYWGFGLLKDLVAKNFLKAGHRSWLAGCDRIQTWWNVFVYLACRDVLLVQSKLIGEHSWSEAREAQISFMLVLLSCIKLPLLSRDEII